MLMADSEVRISKAISYATKALGYSELRPNQELAVKHFLRGHDVFVSLVVVSPRSCPQIIEAYVVSRGKSGRDRAEKFSLVASYAE